MRASRQVIRSSAGFSLIEILTVVFVVGLTLAIAGLTINRGGPRDDLYDAIEKFMGLAQFAGERAILSGESMGLLLEPPLWQAGRGENIEDIGWRYRWYTSSSQGWQALEDLPPVSLPPSIQLEVEIDELEWEYADQLDRTTPIVAVYPTGDITQFALTLRDERERNFVQNIEVNEEGELVWVEAPEPPEVDDDAF